MLQATNIKIGERKAESGNEEELELSMCVGGATSIYGVTETAAVELWLDLVVLLAKWQRSKVESGKRKAEEENRERVSHVVEQGGS